MIESGPASECLFLFFSFSLHHLKGNRPCVTQSRAWLPQSNHGGYCHSARFLFKRWREANHSFPPRHISLIISKMFRPEQQRSNLAIESNVTDLIDSYRGAGAARKLRASISFGFFFLLLLLLLLLLVLLAISKEPSWIDSLISFILFDIF